MKITSGDVMTRVPLRLSRRSLAFYYGKVPSFTYSSLREYKPAVLLLSITIFYASSVGLRYSLVSWSFALVSKEEPLHLC